MNRKLDDLRGLVWSHLLRGAADRHHPARFPTLATYGPDGPEARTLVLRGVSEDAGTLDLHTDMASPKVAQIASEPRVALHVWIPEARLQIRIRGTAVVEPGDPDLFSRLPDVARANYVGAIPGEALPREGGDEGPSRFASIQITVRDIDALILDEPHIRAIFTTPDWTGRWVVP